MLVPVSLLFSIFGNLIGEKWFVTVIFLILNTKVFHVLLMILTTCSYAYKTFLCLLLWITCSCSLHICFLLKCLFSYLHNFIFSVKTLKPHNSGYRGHRWKTIFQLKHWRLTAVDTYRGHICKTIKIFWLTKMTVSPYIWSLSAIIVPMHFGDFSKLLNSVYIFILED